MGGLFFAPMLALIGVLIAWYRRDPRRFLDGPAHDAPLRLMRWATGLLSAERAEWGQAMLGELGYIEGRVRRMRFALGCVGAALVLPPWGRAAAGLWTLVALGAGGVGLYAALIVQYGLGAGAWIGVSILAVFVAGSLLGAGALVRRPGTALPGLVGGLVIALVFLTLTGFTFFDQILPDTSGWHHLVQTIVVPFLVGAAATVWTRDLIAGKRVARLAAITASLGLFVYATLAVTVIGSSGPLEEDGGFTLQGTISDRVGNNMVQLGYTLLLFAVVGWGGAAAAGRLLRRTPPAVPPAADPVPPQGA
ncbi:hypothetical protein [Hamadaea tsunoensis]|uniref:hypothetical protein n=1 Tax=Hamadaea tsunoensis TaxID=53368 RepID=UPI00041F5F22|nr:hypothetical protein [Hamadaea tsunoensis]